MASTISKLKQKRRENDNRVTELFDMIDKDNSGAIEIGELLNALQTAEVKSLINGFAPLKFLLQADQVEKTFTQMDIDSDDESDGMISYHEFKKYCLNALRKYEKQNCHTTVTLDQAMQLLKLDPTERTEDDVEDLVIWIQNMESTKKAFGTLPDDIIHQVMRQARCSTIGEGKFVFEQGDVGSLYYVILEGQVHVYVRSLKDQELEMERNDIGEHRDPIKLASHGRLGKYVRPLDAGESFGEIALMSPVGTRRTASVVTHKAFKKSDDEKRRPYVTFMTLERAVYQRLFKVGQADSSDISDKVRVLMDSFIFSWWPRSQVVQFAIGCNIVKVKKHEFFVRSGQQADHFYIIVTGEAIEVQPIYLRSGGLGQKKRVIFPWDWEILRKRVKPSDPTWRLKKINVGVGLKGPFDLIGCLPMVKKIPYYFKDVRALTNLTAVKISMSYFQDFVKHSGESEISSRVSMASKNSIINQLGTLTEQSDPQQYAIQTVNIINKCTERFDEFRIQRVRAAIDSDGIMTPCTKDMQRKLVVCGRCGNIDGERNVRVPPHTFGDLNLFGKHLCPKLQTEEKNGSTSAKKKFATKKTISRLKENNWKRKSPGAPSYRRSTTSLEKKKWAGKQGTIDRLKYYLKKSTQQKRSFMQQCRPQTVGPGVGPRSMGRGDREERGSGSNNRPSTSGDMIIHRTSNRRLLRQPSRPPINVHIKPRRLSQSPRSMRAAKLYALHEGENQKYMQDILLRRQCVQYIMPRHVAELHIRDDAHDEQMEHDEAHF